MALPPLVVGDIGGTRSRLELLAARDGGLHTCTNRRIAAKFASFDALVDDFYALEPVKRAAAHIKAACFSVAGPVEGRASTLTNLDWAIDARAVSARLEHPGRPAGQ